MIKQIGKLRFGFRLAPKKKTTLFQLGRLQVGFRYEANTETPKQKVQPIKKRPYVKAKDAWFAKAIKPSFCKGNPAECPRAKIQPCFLCIKQNVHSHVVIDPPTATQALAELEQIQLAPA